MWQYCDYKLIYADLFYLAPKCFLKIRNKPLSCRVLTNESIKTKKTKLNTWSPELCSVSQSNLLHLFKCFEVFISSGASICTLSFLWTIRVLKRAIAITSHSSALFVLLMTKHYTTHTVDTAYQPRKLMFTVQSYQTCLGVFWHLLSLFLSYILSAVNNYTNSLLVPSFNLCLICAVFLKK